MTNLLNEHWHLLGAGAYSRLETASNNSPAMGWGEKNREAVKLLQQALSMAHFRITAGPTGNYLAQTTGAVQALQNEWGIAGPRGVAGRDVLRALDDWLASNALAGGQGAAGSQEAASMTAEAHVFEFIIDGRRYRTEGDDLNAQLDHVIQVVYNRIASAADGMRGHLNRQAAALTTAGISDALSGTSLPPVSLLHEGITFCNEAWEALSRNEHSRVSRSIGNALVMYNVFKSQWLNYIDGTVRGAERAATTLDWTSTIFLSAAAAYFTAGASAEVQAGGLALRALIARAGIGAAVNVGVTSVREIAVQTTETLINVDPEVDWRLMTSNVGASGVAGIVSSLAGGWLRPLVANRFPAAIEASFAAEREAWDQAFQRFGIRALPTTSAPIAVRVIASLGQSTLGNLVRTTINAVGTGCTLQQFSDKFWQNMPRDLVAKAIAEAIVGAAQPTTLGVTGPSTR